MRSLYNSLHILFIALFPNAISMAEWNGVTIADQFIYFCSACRATLSRKIFVFAPRVERKSSAAKTMDVNIPYNMVRDEKCRDSPRILMPMEKPIYLG